MVTTNIGRIFLDAYNRKYDTSYSPKAFFDEVYHPIFFNDPKYLMWATNSPFVQMTGSQKAHTLKADERLEKKDNLHTKIRNGDIDASTAIGYSASETKDYATTSGQVSDLKVSATPDDVYYSWFGASLGIGMEGGLSVLFDKPQILLYLFDGWKLYREFLNKDELKIQGNKINSWNGQYLHLRLSHNREPSFLDFQRENILKPEKEGVSFDTVKWTRLFFDLSKAYPTDVWTGYIYSFGQTNKTIGFIQFDFIAAKKLSEFYCKLFGENAAIQDAGTYEELYGQHIMRACEQGIISEMALCPASLMKIMRENKKISFSAKTKDAYEKDLITYRTYKTWLLAMITKNNEEMLEATMRLATILKDFRNNAKKGSRNEANMITSLLESKSKTDFVKQLSEIIPGVKVEDKEFILEFRNWIHYMNRNDFMYTCTLLGFDYTFIEQN